MERPPSVTSARVGAPGALVAEPHPGVRFHGDTPATPPAAPAGRYRWVICGLLFVITVNNYMDRQMLSIAAPAISAEYNFSNSDIAVIANAFLVAYTVGQLLAAFRSPTAGLCLTTLTALGQARAAVPRTPFRRDYVSEPAQPA